MKKLYLFLSLLLITGISFAQCMLYPVNIDQRLSNSNVIVEGKVISSKSFWNERHDYIYTSNLVQVSQVLKGNVNSNFVEVITQGGEIGMNRQVVEPALELFHGQQGVFMLNPAEQMPQFGKSVYQTYSDQQGFILYREEGTAFEPFHLYESINGELSTLLSSKLGRSVMLSFAAGKTQNNQVTPQLQAAPITSINPTTITAGTASQLTITGSGFGASQGVSYVAFMNADAGTGTIQPHATQYVSWSNTQIVVQVPTRASQGGTIFAGTAGTGPVTVNIAGTPMVSGQVLTVTHGQLNVFYTNTVTAQRIFNTRHHGTNGAGGMTWRMHTAFDASLAPKQDFQTAFQKWRCATYINWQIGTTTTVNAVASDGVNVIRWDIGAELPAGVLGVCSSWFSGCTQGPAVNWFVTELDITFDGATTWQFGPGVVAGQTDFESVVLHELGHGHQMSHVINNNQLMHYAIGPAVVVNTINANILAGGNSVMTRNLSGAVCGQAIMTALNATTCIMAAPVASFNIPATACVGQNITLTDLSTNVPSSWLWTMTGGVPSSANTQNTSTSYGTTGVKTITLTATNGQGNSTITKTINIVATPTLAVTSSSICEGGTTTLTANGTLSYTWNPGPATGSVQALSPAATTDYTVTGSNGTCTNSAIGTVTVFANPTVQASPSPTAICEGATATIAISGANSYTALPGNLTGANISVSPSVSTTYTITGSDANTCANTVTVFVQVDPCSGIAENSLLNTAQVYPNPVKDQLNIEFSDAFSGKLEVINAIGQVVAAKAVNNDKKIRLDLSQLAKGIYSVKLSSGDTQKTYKVVKD